MTKHPTPPYNFLNRPDYFAWLATSIAATKEGERIALATMPLDTRVPTIQHIMDELCAAAQRGVHVRLCIDAYTFLMSDRFRPGPLWYGQQLTSGKLKQPYAGYYQQLEHLKKAGGSYVITNIPSKRYTLPQKGRSHIKFAVINDVVALGGHNLITPEENDVMAVFTNRLLATYLWEFAQKLTQGTRVRDTLHDADQHFSVSNDVDLYIDAGVPKQSRILQEALAIIDRSQKWLVFTCQYFPGGITGKHLAQAIERGVNVTLIYNGSWAHGAEQPMHALYNTIQKIYLPKELFKYQIPAEHMRLHAKLVASEREAMLGSHNYVVQGVQLGTAEIALHVRDSQFGSHALQTLAPALPRFIATHIIA